MKRNQVDEVFDTFLKSTGEQTLEGIYDEYIKEFPEDAQETLPELDKKMQKVFRRAKAKERRAYHPGRIRRIVAMLLIAFGVGGFTIMQVDAWRIKVSNLVLEITHAGVGITFEDDATGRKDTEIASWTKTPGYLPKGFETKTIVQLSTKFTMVLEKGVDVITYEQDPYDAINFTEVIASENSQKIQIGDHGEGQLIEDNDQKSGGQYTKVIWRDENYVYRLTGTISKEEMIKIAESVK